MDAQTIISFAVTGVSVLAAIITTIKDIRKAIKNKQWAKLKELLHDEIVPLMEQAERALQDGVERENWVLKKLSEKTHIDFYKYANILNLAKSIIEEICKTTKIDVNKVIVVEDKDETKGVTQSVFY